MSKTITNNQRLELLGLLTLARKHREIVDQCDEAMAEIAGVEVGGLLSDAIYEPVDLDTTLARMGIEVEPGGKI